ncbi:MAG: DEAD/DEAH box helicase [Chloroflexi bacterium]|nr:DEAD/DEAH box helicase [Chloroflexota bacterium]
MTLAQAPIAPGIELHPVVDAWFRRHFDAPTDAQHAGWRHIRSRRDTLISAPTGSGKTLAAFLAGIDELVRKAEAGTLEDVTEIVYVSPLKALGNDIHRNLEQPLEEIRQIAVEMGYDLPVIRTAVRSGDTTQSERQAIVRRPPHILITTPESLYLMVTAARSREKLHHVRTLIVDEIHALARDRRGSHFALTAARLDHVITSNGGERPARIGLSATQRPIEEIAAFLVGSEHIDADGAPDCTIVDLGHQRDIDLAIEVPGSELGAVAPAEQWGEIYDRITELITGHRTTLVFVNTRRMSERVAHQLAQRLGEEHVSSHHGSLSKERRMRLEQRLKDGELRALVATASLELGIDIGSIDLVCQVGSPRSIATFLQRVGRSGHALGVRPKGRIFPASRDELMESAALVRAVGSGRLDRIVQLVAPLDVLAQQIVAESACEEWPEDDLHELFRRATPYRDLSREDFGEVVDMLAQGVGEGAGRARPLLHRDRVNGVLRARRNARPVAIQNGGTIPELGDYRVIAEPDETVVGAVNEDWAIESMAGNIFLLGTNSWRIRRIENGVVRVEDAHGAPPTIPFWLGEAPGRTIELSEEVGRLRRDVEEGLSDREHLKEQLIGECGLDLGGAQQIIDYVRATRDGLGIVPTDRDVVFERFFDESGGMQLVVHAPFGARINRAWGLALRKRFCVRFDFELQAAANDDGILLSLGPQHSFPLEETYDYVTSNNAEEAVRQSCFYIPLFPTRWRWNTTRALAVPRQRGGKRVQPYLQRMIADDLLAAVFPEQVGCQENVTGPLEMPDHVLLRQTMDDCLHEAMDVDSLLGVLGRVEAGDIRFHARDTTEPSPMAHEIVNGKPYTYLDDAPLEERRTRAVSLRRSLPEEARDLGELDIEAIDGVREQAWPAPRDAEEVHDTLLGLVAIDEQEASGWSAWFEELADAGRASRLTQVGGERDGQRLWFAAEHLPAIELLYPDARIEPALDLPEGAALPCPDRDEARRILLRGHSEVRGPMTASALGALLALRGVDVDRGFRQLEASGFILRGRFTPGRTTSEAEGDEDEFCDRRLLARIHRLTLDRLRREIDPVTAQDFMRFLLRWQHLAPGSQLEGRGGVREAVSQLQGFEAPSSSWEHELLAARVKDYGPAWLDELCLAGEVAWARLAPPHPNGTNGDSNGNGAAAAKALRATRVTPMTLALRPDLPQLLTASRFDAASEEGPQAGAAAEILAELRARGALFFDELVAATRRLQSDIEGGLRELIAAGLVASDGFQGLRQLTRRRNGRRRPRGGLRGGGGPLGRWALVHAPEVDPAEVEPLAERVAEVLLKRYGVVFRDVVAAESFRVPWREVLRALRRFEARGTVRGGRFVSGFVGEQFALPEALEALRRVRKSPRTGERVRIAASDPLNLTGTILPGPRIPAVRDRSFELEDGALAEPLVRPSSAREGRHETRRPPPPLGDT